MLTWITGQSSRTRLMFFVNLQTFASTAFVFMHSIAIKFLGFLEENISDQLWKVAKKTTNFIPIL